MVSMYPTLLYILFDIAQMTTRDPVGPTMRVQARSMHSFEWDLLSPLQGRKIPASISTKSRDELETLAFNLLKTLKQRDKKIAGMHEVGGPYRAATANGLYVHGPCHAVSQFSHKNQRTLSYTSAELTAGAPGSNGSDKAALEVTSHNLLKNSANSKGSKWLPCTLSDQDYQIQLTVVLNVNKKPENCPTLNLQEATAKLKAAQADLQELRSQADPNHATSASAEAAAAAAAELAATQQQLQEVARQLSDARQQLAEASDTHDALQRQLQSSQAALNDAVTEKDIALNKLGKRANPPAASANSCLLVTSGFGRQAASQCSD